ncbi:MAG: hypothetical protein ABL957_07630 [Parvularculaceae bacterium]
MSDPDGSQIDDYARLDGRVASLSAALLARKGGAAPSLKRFAPQRTSNPFSGAPAPCASTGCPETAGAKAPREKRAAFTLRLPIPDFLRLKLAAAQFERTSQAILLDALRSYLDTSGVEKLDDCACLRKAAAEEAQKR